jgi:hypothetical protein
MLQKKSLSLLFQLRENIFRFLPAVQDEEAQKEDEPTTPQQVSKPELVTSSLQVNSDLELQKSDITGSPDLNLNFSPSPPCTEMELNNLTHLESEKRRKELILDLSGVSYLDRKGAELVQRLETEAGRLGWRVGVVATPSQAVLLGGLVCQLFPTYSDAFHLWRRPSGHEDTEGFVTRL